ncbi:MAG: mannitol dehydrogenase family protein [Oscillospiraceae bacterium]|nr:mannitol dehydrogenase family protein [Oscillospiraceae bacterium]
MLKLDEKSLQEKEAWESSGFILPRFDRCSVKKRTLTSPKWIHFGAGNIFRAYIADIVQQLLNEGLLDTGVIVAEGYDEEIIDVAYAPYDNLCVNVVLRGDGCIDKEVLASVVESVKMDADGFLRLKEIFASSSLQMVSLTITEKGYSLYKGDGSFFDDVAADFEASPAASEGSATPVSYMGKLAALCYHRYLNGATPLTLVSMDNVSQNGKCLHDAIRLFAEAWVGNGFVDDEFLAYVDDPDKLSFPWTMIDKITPGPSTEVAAHLRECGLQVNDMVITEKNTEVASFVNAEETGYLVIEDTFPNGRPPLTKAGVILTDRETVTKVEKMKVCTCLNPLHTSLAVFGCSLGLKRVSEIMRDNDLVKLVKMVAEEGMSVVVDPGIISPKEFADTVINVRLPNPFIPDTPQRIATDTSKKIAVRFGETIIAYSKSDSLDVHTLRAIPLSLAGWCRYLVGIDDDGNKFPLDPDPMLTELQAIFSGFTLGSVEDYSVALKPLLSNASIFGVDLYRVGVAERVVGYFKALMAGQGAVRRVLGSL